MRNGGILKLKQRKIRMEKKSKKVKKIKFELTREGALEILGVAGNGYGGGDYYETGGYGDEKQEKEFLIAFETMAKKLNLLHTTP